MFRKIYQGRNTVLVDMFVENGHKRTFLETLVKDYNAKKKNNDSGNYTNSKKIPWLPDIGPKHLARIYKVFYAKTNRSYYLIVFLECTSWTVHAMVDKLANQRKKY